MRLDRTFHKYMHVAGEIDGWLSNTTALISHSLIRFQSELNVKGNICEIGVHHGRYFIALLTSINMDELGVAVDLFENQSENIDNSGRGDSAIFLANVERFSRVEQGRNYYGQFFKSNAGKTGHRRAWDKVLFY